MHHLRHDNPVTAPYLSVTMPPGAVDGYVSTAAQMYADDYRYSPRGSTLVFRRRESVVLFVRMLRDAMGPDFADEAEKPSILQAIQIVKDAAAGQHAAAPSRQAQNPWGQHAGEAERRMAALTAETTHAFARKVASFARELVENLGQEEAHAFAREQMDRVHQEAVAIHPAMPVASNFWADVTVATMPRRGNPITGDKVECARCHQQGPRRRMTGMKVRRGIVMREGHVCEACVSTEIPRKIAAQAAVSEARHHARLAADRRLYEGGSPCRRGPICMHEPGECDSTHGPLSYDDLCAGDRVTFVIDERGQTHSGRATPGHDGWMVEGAPGIVSAENFVSAFRPPR